MATLTREQLEDRLAALHRASLELVQDISLDSLLERIAGVACEQSGACYGAVGVLNQEGQLSKFITVGLTPQERRLMRNPPEGKGLIGALMHTDQAIRLSDLRTDPRSVGYPRHHPEMTSFLGVPIRRGDRHLGQIYLTNKIGANSFTEEDQQVIETLATYAAIAISNANLYNQLVERDRVLTQRNEDLALLNDLAATLASSTESTPENLDQILDRALTQVMDYLGLEVGELYLREGDAETLYRANRHTKNNQGLWKNETYRLGESIVGEVALTGQHLVLALPNPKFLDLENNTFSQIACFPLTARSGTLGVLCVSGRQPREFDDLDISFLAAISSWIATVVDNMRLELNQRRLAVLEERDRIGMDLHDGVIQSIYAVGLTLEHARLLLVEDPQKASERIDQAISNLNSTIRDIRSYILDLRPRQLNDDNLMQGIQRLVNEFRVNTLAEVNLQGQAEGLTHLATQQAKALFHICQEALANTAKHARARRVNLSVWSTAERVVLEVADDGRGFDTAKTRTSLGHGLSNMQTRARNAGGDVEINSDPEQGTTVMAWVPFKHAA